MRTSGGQATCSKYWNRQGSASQIGIGRAQPIGSGRSRCGRVFSEFGGVEVAQHRIVGHLHLGHRLQVLAEQEARAGIAGDLQDLGEEPPIPQHRVALLAAERRQHDQPSLVRIVVTTAAGRSSGRSPAACRPGRPAPPHTPRAPRRCRPSGWPTAPRRSRRRGHSAPAGRPAHAGPAPPDGRSPPAPAAHSTTARCPPRGRSSPCRCGRRPAACCAAPSGATGRPPARPRRWSARCAGRCRCCGVAGAFSRGSGRVSISFSRPPTPIFMISDGTDRQPGEQPRQHEVDAVELRAARAAGQHQRRPRADAAEADQVAGVHRHAEMQDLAARRARCRRGRRRAGPPPPRRRPPAAGRRLGKSAIPVPCRSVLPRAARAAAAAASRSAGSPAARSRRWSSR